MYYGHRASWEQSRQRGYSGHRFGRFLPRRRFPTTEETIGRLEEYLKELQAEAKGVEERIAELKKKQN